MTDYHNYFESLIARVLSGELSRADAAAHVAGTIHIDEIGGGPQSLLTNCEWSLRHAAIPHYFTTEREFAYLLACLRGELSFSQSGQNAAIHAAHGGLQMTRAQRRQLIACLYFRDRTMSVAALMRFNWRGFAIFLVLGGATVAAALLVGSHLMAWVFGAAYAGMILRDIGHCVRVARAWPLSKQLLDWPRIEEMAREIGVLPATAS